MQKLFEDSSYIHKHTQTRLDICAHACNYAHTFPAMVVSHVRPPPTL